MEQEERAHQGDDGKLLHKGGAEGRHGAFDQRRAVVHRHDLHARRQALLEAVQAFLHAVDGGQGVGAAAHHDDAADHFALAVEFGNAAPHGRAHAQFGNVAEQRRHAVLIGAQGDGGKVVETAQIASEANHVLGFGHFHHGCAGFAVAALDGAAEVGQGEAEGA